MAEVIYYLAYSNLKTILVLAFFTLNFESNLTASEKKTCGLFRPSCPCALCSLWLTFLLFGEFLFILQDSAQTSSVKITLYASLLSLQFFQGGRRALRSLFPWCLTVNLLIIYYVVVKLLFIIVTELNILKIQQDRFNKDRYYI